MSSTFKVELLNFSFHKTFEHIPEEIVLYCAVLYCNVLYSSTLPLHVFVRPMHIAALGVFCESMSKKYIFVILDLGKGPKKNVKMWSLTITGGGVSLNHTLIAKCHCFFKQYVYVYAIAVFCFEEFLKNF